MKFYYLLVLSLLLSLGTNAQSPGYKGARFLIQADFGLFPNLFGTSPKGRNIGGSYDAFPDGALGMTYTYGGRVNYVLSRRVAAVLAYNYYRVGDPSSEYLSDYEYYDFLSRVNVNSIGLGVKLFKTRRGSIAPVGLYTQVLLRYNLVSSKPVAALPLNILSQEMLDDAVAQKSGTVTFDVEFGNTIKIVNNLNFSWGFKAAIPLYYGNIWDVGFGGREAFKSNIFSINLGLGYFF